MLRRRIGANELDVINICRGYVEAQQEYASERHDGATVNQYAQRIISTEGKHDGLAWRNPDGTWGGPVGSSVARAIEQGYAERKPSHGYYFKVLEGQGPSARLGQLDYFIDGAMLLPRPPTDAAEGPLERAHAGFCSSGMFSTSSSCGSCCAAIRE
jgi:hypothetical protein